MLIRKPGCKISLRCIDNNRLFQLLSLISLWLLSVAGSAAEPVGGINWSITPYIWATETQYDLKLDGSPVDDDTISFNDLMDTTDASFQVVTEAGLKDGNWSTFVDLTYLKTSDTDKGQLLRVDADSEQWFIDAAVAWWPQGESGGLSLFAGGRYTDLDDELDFKLSQSGQRLGKIRNDRDFLDALLGVRKHFQLAESWSLFTRADYSFGDSEGIYQLQAVFRYAMGKQQQYGLMFGYRYKEAEFDQNKLKEEYTYKGPLLAFNFRL